MMIKHYTVKYSRSDDVLPVQLRSNRGTRRIDGAQKCGAICTTTMTYVHALTSQ